MIGEGEPLDTAADGPTRLNQAKEAVQAAAETVRQTTCARDASGQTDAAPKPTISARPSIHSLPFIILCPPLHCRMPCRMR